MRELEFLGKDGFILIFNFFVWNGFNVVVEFFFLEVEFIVLDLYVRNVIKEKFKEVVLCKDSM